MTCRGLEYDLSSEKWRTPHRFQHTNITHRHILDLVNNDSTYGSSRVWLIDPKEHGCIFCRANLTFNRTLKEILYHFNKWPDDAKFPGSGVVHRTLIEKWENNVDAWDNPIGENIKG